MKIKSTDTKGKINKNSFTLTTLGTSSINSSLAAENCNPKILGSEKGKS
jgi:hypothetical protein